METPWYENEPEGKILRNLITNLNEKLQKADDVRLTLDISRSIGYLAVIKNTLAKSNLDYDKRLEDLERLAGLRKEELLRAR